MLRLLIILLCLLLSFPTSAQTKKDSLFRVWNNTANQTLDLLEALTQYCDEPVVMANNDSIGILADKILELATTMDAKKYLGDGHRLKGRFFALSGDFISSKHQLKLALKNYRESGNKFGEARALDNLSTLISLEGNVVGAIRHASDALKIMQSINDQAGIAATSSTLSQNYRVLGRSDLVMVYAEQCIKAANLSKDKQRMVDAYIKMGDALTYLKEDVKATKYYQKGYDLAISNGDETRAMTAMVNLASVEKELGHYEVALHMYQQVYAYYRRINQYVGRLNAMLQLSVVYTEMSDFKNAQIALDSLKMWVDQNPNFKSTKINSYIIGQQGSIYLKKKEYNKAIHAFKRAFEVAEETNDLSVKLHVAQSLFEAYKGANQPANALFYHEKYLGYKDSMQLEESAKKMQQREFAQQLLEDSLKQVEKEQKINLAHQDEVRKKNRTRNILGTSGLIVLLIAGGLYSRVRYIRKAKNVIEEERDRSDNLLLNILPEEIAKELKEKGKADARDFDMVSMLFTDFKQFTQTSEKISAQVLVGEINACFEAFDAIMEKYGIEKIKTIGDAYMAAGGLPIPSDDSVKNTILAGLEMQEFIIKRKKERDEKGLPAFEMRVGIHTGPVVAGIVGVKKFQYDIWGDTVNTANRMESYSADGKVNISKATYELVKDDPDFDFENRGKIEVKGKGEMAMFFVRHSS